MAKPTKDPVTAAWSEPRAGRIAIGPVGWAGNRSAKGFHHDQIRPVVVRLCHQHISAFRV